MLILSQEMGSYLPERLLLELMCYYPHYIDLQRSQWVPWPSWCLFTVTVASSKPLVFMRVI